jgi:hypothetical protein
MVNKFEAHKKRRIKELHQRMNKFKRLTILSNSKNNN